jgi:hypothetical protein
MKPRDFEVNRTWLAFRATQKPIAIGGAAFDIFVLQDAASMYILGHAFAPHGAECPPEAEVEKLMEQAWSQNEEWPEELVLPETPSPDNSFVRVANRNGVAVRAVAASRISHYVRDVRTSLGQFIRRGGIGTG